MHFVWFGTDIRLCQYTLWFTTNFRAGEHTVCDIVRIFGQNRALSARFRTDLRQDSTHCMVQY